MKHTYCSFHTQNRSLRSAVKKNAGHTIDIGFKNIPQQIAYVIPGIILTYNILTFWEGIFIMFTYRFMVMVYLS